MTRTPPRATAPQRWVRWFAATSVGGWLFARGLHHLDRGAFRLFGRRMTVTSVVAGLPVVMLTTTGARTGRLHTVPVLGFRVDGGLVIAAGNFGQKHEPAWCLNLRRDSQARVVLDGRVGGVVAEELAGEVRAAAWGQCLAVYPGGAAYARRAAPRVIALFRLHPDAARPVDQAS